MALTRMAGPSARASPTVNAFSAPLLSMQASDEPRPMIDATDEMLTMAPPGGACSSGAKARESC